VRRAALLALGLLAGCSVLHNPHGSPEADAWKAARERWTRTARLYSRFETHAIATATYQAPEVRRHRVQQVAAWKAMTAEEKGRAQAAEDAEAARGEEFLVSLFTTDPRDNDLDDSRTVWRVALVLPEGDLLPAEIRAVRVDTLLRDLSPFIREFDTVYRVRFPKVKGDPLERRSFTLRIAGSEGTMDFAYGPE
jgi:hypothetical protein